MYVVIETWTLKPEFFAAGMALEGEVE